MSRNKIAVFIHITNPFLRKLQKFTRAHWLICIVNMPTDTTEREREIRPFVNVKNKLMSVCNASVLLLTMNFVTEHCQSSLRSRVDPQTTLAMFSDEIHDK